jgi:hypothetical protein
MTDDELRKRGWRQHAHDIDFWANVDDVHGTLLLRGDAVAAERIVDRRVAAALAEHAALQHAAEDAFQRIRERQSGDP